MRDRAIMLAAWTLWLCILVGTGVAFFSHQGEGSFLLMTTRFIASLMLSLAYLMMGAIVWFWVNQRRVALLLGAFCLAMAVTFAGETAAVQGDHLISAMTGISSSCAFLLFAVLLFQFPYNLGSRNHFTTALSWVLTVLCVAGGGGYAVVNNIAYPAPQWLNTLGVLYDILVIVTIVATMGISYFLSSPRDRGMNRLILLSIALSFLPLLLLTILPQALGLPSRESIDSQYTTLFFALLPVALGYVALRHQLVVVDRRAQRITFSVATAICLLLATYLCWLLTVLFFTDRVNRIAFFTITCFLFFNGIWIVAGKMTRAIFTPVRLRWSPPRFLSTMHMTSELAGSLMEALDTSTVLIFLKEPLSPETYQLIAPLQTHETHLWKGLAPSLFNDEEGEGPILDSTLIAQLEILKRPVRLGDLLGENQRTRSMRTHQQGGDPLCVPLVSQQALIGVLVLARPKSSLHPLGIPDVEQIQDIIGWYQPMIDTAFSIERQQKTAQRLSTFYSNHLSTKLFPSPNEARTALALVVAESVGGRVEVWTNGDGGFLARTAAAGHDSPSLAQEAADFLQERGGQARFFDNEGNMSGPHEGDSRNIVLPREPFAWLPLVREKRRLGAVAIIYRPPHSFSHDERETLTTFAMHCAAVLDDTQVMIEGERLRHDCSESVMQDQAEAGRLREKVLPMLLAVDGYIQILSLYRERFSAEQEAFVQEKARRLLLQVIDEVARLPRSPLSHSPPW